MASVGHVAIGMAAARIAARPAPAAGRAMLFWSLLSMLPDADVIGFPLGVAYGDPWGHRGATHSLTFALGVGGVLGVAAAIRGWPVIRTAVIGALVLASHGILDTMTDGGLGCALLWPFDATRYFAPWNPIPVSPIGAGYLSAYGLRVALTELILFSPVFLFACWPRARATGSSHR